MCDNGLIFGSMVFFRPHKHNTKYNELVTIKKITVVVGGIGGGGGDGQ